MSGAVHLREFHRGLNFALEKKLTRNDEKLCDKSAGCFNGVGRLGRPCFNNLCRQHRCFNKVVVSIYKAAVPETRDIIPL